MERRLVDWTDELRLRKALVGWCPIGRGFVYRLAFVGGFGSNDSSWRLPTSVVTAVARCLLLLQNSLQIGGKPDCIRNQPGVEGRHVGISVVVGSLLSTAAVSDDARQHFGRRVDDERVTAQGRTQ